MTAYVKDGDTWKPRVSASVKDGGTWKTIISAHVKDGGTWKLVWDGAVLAISANPTSDTAEGSFATIVSSTVTATATGGSPSYTYQWTQVNGDAITIDSATSASTTFRVTGMSPSEIRDGEFICTVTDALSNTASTDSVLITFIRN